MMVLAASEREMAEFFDQCAQKGLMQSFCDEELDLLRYYLAQWSIEKGHYVLEPGCGSGRLTCYLAESVGTEGHVDALDVAHEMIIQAGRHQLGEHVSFMVGSVMSLEFPAQRFDRIICAHVFPHFVDPTRALKEFLRVLKPEGKLWITHFENSEKINSRHSRSIPERLFHPLPVGDQLCCMLNTAGFELLSFENGARGYSVSACPRC